LVDFGLVHKTDVISVFAGPKSCFAGVYVDGLVGHRKRWGLVASFANKCVSVMVIVAVPDWGVLPHSILGSVDVSECFIEEAFFW
jgi:hypothetical protein